MKKLLYGTILSALCFCISAAQARQQPDAELRDMLRTAMKQSPSFGNRIEAEMWLMDMSRRLEKKVPDPRERFELLALVHAEARRVNLAPELVLAVIEVESAFNPWAISKVGAQGLMQVMPFWLDEITHSDNNLFRVDTNLRFGCTILRHYLDKERGNLVRALARYNGSLGSYGYANRVMSALRTKWYRP